MLYRYKGNDAVTRDDLPPNVVLMIERTVEGKDGERIEKDVTVTCIRKLTQEEMTAAGLTEWKEL